MEDINNKFILISPDQGSLKKIYKLAEQIGYKGDIITCSKDRDNDGKLTRTVVPLTKDYDFSEHNYNHTKDYIIIDDICDGGATFINIAKELKNKFNKDTQPKIYLIVTHGIFSQGLLQVIYENGIFSNQTTFKEIRERISKI